MADPFKPPRQFKAQPSNKSKGILDDAPIRKTISTRQGTITHIPTEHNDIVNKQYVDDSIPANLSLFFTENGSDIGGAYLDMEVSPVTDAEENTLTAIPANSTGTLMATFATLLNDSVISGIVELPIGVYGFHIHCQASSAAKLSMYAELYHRNVGGTETLLLTSEDSNLIPIAKGSIGFHGTLTTEKEWASDDRIVIKLYGKNNSAASRDLTIYVEGTTATRAELPAIRGTIAPALWDRTGTVLSPVTAGDNIETSGAGVFEGLNPYGIGTADLGSGTFKWRTLFLTADANVGGNVNVTGTVDGIDIATDVAANTSKTSYTKTNIKGHVFHDSTAGTARATGFTSVEWVGSVEPNNAVNGDTWIDTT